MSTYQLSRSVATGPILRSHASKCVFPIDYADIGTNEEAVSAIDNLSHEAALRIVSRNFSVGVVYFLANAGLLTKEDVVRAAIRTENADVMRWAHRAMDGPTGNVLWECLFAGDRDSGSVVMVDIYRILFRSDDSDYHENVAYALGVACTGVHEFTKPVLSAFVRCMTRDLTAFTLTSWFLNGMLYGATIPLPMLSKARRHEIAVGCCTILSTNEKFSVASLLVCSVIGGYTYIEDICRDVILGM